MRFRIIDYKMRHPTHNLNIHNIQSIICAIGKTLKNKWM